MSGMADLLDNLVPVSDLQRSASATLDRVREGSPVVIMRRGVPAAVMITPEEWREYERLREDAEDAADLALAKERLAKWDGDTTSLRRFEDVMSELGVTDKELEGVEVELE
ncbi:type II toxin-antitoxin system prevent-host-death family antitoxin [Thermophilibacter provencensis]|uniref:Antitoxin n=1 Tax=Thermophilibacter provencensis TaxID=1852386 RepID=A0ABT7V176_9ACTN|nr:type II toxin-antitoxin system prevent-host-death family antitoxin [Thermophilibacter provencensis]MDM8270352.1 type II toxin-antitoxin system prevent-host-death family antitoxin [Thermophilibacter provencensis]